MVRYNRRSIFSKWFFCNSRVKKPLCSAYWNFFNRIACTFATGSCVCVCVCFCVPENVTASLSEVHIVFFSYSLFSWQQRWQPHSFLMPLLPIAFPTTWFFTWHNAFIPFVYILRFSQNFNQVTEKKSTLKTSAILAIYFSVVKCQAYSI